ncbi:restriction endonuclease subunit S domain-containing protein [Vibrio parahaemolyticus]|uniref:restriction endonuclease subunit S n=1 Tax=Vibrio parahaemolyticus TaxID=670 RepID=UPI000C28F50B|nr:restriction endonuclease subunit S [Vibrio parahaemolyticus]EIA3184624.1 restriction endonuclease subunit S [Vibrio parahaemolyticus]PJR23980.1 restriction endonuclease subunit S [Vibrio parahaemolyticus]HAS6930716.1 restriction endonuclease subunit S [Vibrio parahaemolyticus]
MYHIKVLASLDDRLDAEFYNPAALRTIQRMEDVGEVVTLGSLIQEGYRVVYHGTDSINGLKQDQLLPFLSPTQIDKDGAISFEIAEQLPKYYKDEYPKGLAKEGELLVEVKGNVSKVAVVPSVFPKSLMISGSLYKASINQNKADTHYILAFLKSASGQVLKDRLTSNTIINYIAKDALYSIPVFKISMPAQKYIGEKVRQAERLRSLVKLLDCELNSLVLSDALEEANRTAIQSFNRVDVEDMFPRLDPKYYGNRSLSVLHAASSSYSLDSLKKSINNGFEERDFVDSGIDYITVSEVSSGRIELSTAPKISVLTDIPDKAYVNERCVLVVRTGSIGTAVKVDVRDKNAVISSHLIKLEFDTEELAAAVAAFLNSASGKILQRKISYGAVQPQIGQDELLALPIPRFVLDNADSILALTQAKENAIRCSRWLTQSAKLFVEDLIEGQLTESQLVSAQQALEAGDDSLDRALLERMTAEGVDGEGDPLFDDIDQLYDLLEQAKQALDAEDTMAEV